MKLCQVIAVEKATKGRCQSELTEAHHALQKPALLNGISRAYSPKLEDGDKLPPENTKVQVNAEDMIKNTTNILTKLFDVTATRDWGNTHACADVVVNGETLITGAPVPFLLWLEKQLVDLATFCKKLPTLDPSETWHRDETTNSWASEASETVRTKKVLRNHVLTQATDKHPAQVQTYSEDVQEGTWKTVKFSGALPASRVAQLISRVTELQSAVKMAREEANSAEVKGVSVGGKVLGYLFR